MKQTLELTATQKSIVNKALENRYAAIRGSAGSGKTIMALNLAKRLKSKNFIELDDLKHQCDLVSIVSYTHSLSNYLRSKDTIEDINVSAVYDFFQIFLDKINSGLVPSNLKKDYLNDQNVSIELNKYDLYDEMNCIFNHGFKTAQEYIDHHQGNLDTAILTSIYDATMRYRTYMKIRKLIDYNDVPNYILDKLELKQYEPLTIHMIIDEVQDLSPSSIKALCALTKKNVYFVGDMTQSLYKSNFNWNTSLPKDTEIVTINTNFRNTRQIFDAANSILRYDTYLNEQARKNYSDDSIEVFAEGLRPQAFFCQDIHAECLQIAYKINEIRKESLDDSICIAFRKNTEKVEAIINELTTMGFHIEQSKKSLYEKKESIMVSTMHSLKGLEFDHIILIEMNESMFFEYGDQNESLERRLMYVSMTRARKSLSLFTSEDIPVRFIAEIAVEKVVPIALNIPGYEKAYHQHLETIDKKRQVLRDSFEKSIDIYTHLENRIETLSNIDETELNILRDQLAQVKESVRNIEKSIVYFERLQHASRERIDAIKTQPSHVRLKKVLLIGGSGIQKADISKLMVELGLPSDVFDCKDYNEIKNFDIKRLKNSQLYSDIFVASVPHNSKGKGDSTSLVQHLRDNQKDYPKVTFIYEGSSLVNFTKTNLKNALYKSMLYAEIHHRS